MAFEIPEEALSVIILVGNEQRFNINPYTSWFSPIKYYTETEEMFNERVEKSQSIYSQVFSNNIKRLKYILEISKNDWQNMEYTPQRIAKGEIIPDRIIYSPYEMDEFFTNYSCYKVENGWIETQRGGYLGKLTTDNLLINRRLIWLDQIGSSQEILRRASYSPENLEAWRKNYIAKEEEYQKEKKEDLDMENIIKEGSNPQSRNTCAVVSSPMKRLRPAKYSFPCQILIATKTNPPLAPRGMVNNFK